MFITEAANSNLTLTEFQERLRLSDKFRPRSAMSSSGSKNRPKSASSSNGAAATKNGSAAVAAGAPIAGRITLKMATTNAPTADNLVSKDCFFVNKE